MSYLFYYDESNGIVLRPDCVKLSPELAVLDEKELRFIILVYDYHSKYRKYPEADRIRKAMIEIWDGNVEDKLDTLKMKTAIAEYKALQYDPKIDLVISYQLKIEKMKLLIDEDDSPSSIRKTTETIDLLMRQIRELESEVTDSVIRKGQIKGGQELSFLEELQRNKKYYNSVIAKK